MPEDQFSSLPFLTRKMLAFEHATVLSLRVISQASVAGTVFIRGMTREGTFTFKHTTVSTSQPTTTDFRIPDFPIFVTVESSGVTFIQGEAFFTVSILINGDRLCELCSGFVHHGKGITYPATNNPDPMPDHGNIGIVQSADPAANVEASITVPGGEIWRVLSLQIQLVTDANAANRRVHFVLSQYQSIDINCFSSIDQTASQTKLYSVAHFGAITDETDDNDILVPMPSDIWLTGDDSIATQTLNRQVGDNFGVMRARIERFFRKPI